VKRTEVDSLDFVYIVVYATELA